MARAKAPRGKLTLTTFQVGDYLRSRVTAQGMTRGSLYVVVDLSIMSTPFGQYVGYTVQEVQEESAGPMLQIRNAPFVMERAQ